MRKPLRELKRVFEEREEARTDGGREDATAEGGRADARMDGGTATSGETSVRRRLTSVRKRFRSDFYRSMPFWLPPFLLMGFFVYGAIGWNLLLSLTDFEGFGDPDYSNLDFEMYFRAFSDPAFIEAARNTFALLVAFTTICLVVGLLMAILVDRSIRFENTFRTIYLLPMSLSFVVTAQFWLWMYNVNNGIVNELLGLAGLGPYNWIGNPELVLSAIIFALVWQFSGYAMVVYLSGLRTIPTDHFEAARVDGASTVRMYWRIIIPQLKSAMVSAAVVLMVFALKAFDFLFSMFASFRPQKGADILATKMVRTAFSRLEWAYGSAIAILLFLMALGIIGPYLYYQHQHGHL